MNKPISKKEAVDAATVLLGYCSTFDSDNKARVKHVKSKHFSQSGMSILEAKRQLANHKGQAHHIKKIEVLSKTIRDILSNNVTYRDV